jgi:hypothetical protein
VLIGDRLRAIREERKLSQGDIEKRTGLLRCYTKMLIFELHAALAKKGRRTYMQPVAARESSETIYTHLGIRPAGGGQMDLHCPRCKSTDLKKLSLAY